MLPSNQSSVLEGKLDIMVIPRTTTKGKYYKFSSTYLTNCVGLGFYIYSSATDSGWGTPTEVPHWVRDMSL